MSKLQEKLEEHFQSFGLSVCKELVKEMETYNEEVMLRTPIMEWITDSGKTFQVQLVVTDNDGEKLDDFQTESTTFQSVEEFMERQKIKGINL